MVRSTAIAAAFIVAFSAASSADERPLELRRLLLSTDAASAVWAHQHCDGLALDLQRFAQLMDGVELAPEDFTPDAGQDFADAGQIGLLNSTALDIGREAMCADLAGRFDGGAHDGLLIEAQTASDIAADPRAAAIAAHLDRDPIDPLEGVAAAMMADRHCAGLRLDHAAVDRVAAEAGLTVDDFESDRATDLVFEIGRALRGRQTWCDDAARFLGGERPGLVAPASSSAGAQPATIPDYNIRAYCAEVAETIGGSRQIELVCVRQEERARDMAPSLGAGRKTLAYCDEVAASIGGSYQILTACLRQEQAAGQALDDL